MTAPNITIGRRPVRSAIRPMMMPPIPVPSQAREKASAGTERGTPSSAAIGLSATTATSGPP